MRPSAVLNSKFQTPLALGAMILTLVVGFFAFTRTALWQSQDFSVFWWAGRHLAIEQIPVYDVARDGAMAFKYPPWVAPFFVPFAYLRTPWAKALWALLSAGSLAFCIRWLAKNQSSLHRALVVALFFWGIWAVHLMDGQIVLPILALCLWGYDRRESPWARAVVYLALSVKVAPLALGFVWFEKEKQQRFRGVFAALALVFVLSIPAAWIGNRGDRPVLEHWVASMSSTGDWFEGDKSRGRDNQGVTALVLRAARVPAADKKTETRVSIAVMVLIWSTFLWLAHRMKASDGNRWLAGLCVVAAVHPLAWFHTFVFCFPAAVVATARGKTALAWFAVVLVGLITRQTLGDLGAALEMLSVKGLGALLLAWITLRQQLLSTEPSTDDL